MKKIFAEPLVIFLILGGALFWFFASVGVDEDAGNTEVSISKDQVKQQVLRFERVWQRQPTEGELQDLIQAYVDEEILYREALALGLDKDDALIRRHLSQKLAFISEDITPVQPPSESELQRFLDANQSKYSREPSYTFTQIFIDPAKHQAPAALVAQSLLESLDAPGADVAAMGDPIMIKHRFTQQTAVQVEQILGSQFANSLSNMLSDRWYGPVESAFGFHLVRIDAKTAKTTVTLGEVREQVERDWQAHEQARLNAAFMRQLRKKYTLHFDENVLGRYKKILTDSVASDTWDPSGSQQ